MFCQECGAQMDEVAGFCSRCGKPAHTPPTERTSAVYQPHRGSAVLVLGILGLVVCAIFGIVAWVMANNDLREMEAGRMDPAGMGLTKAGKICGMVGTSLLIAGVGIYAIVLIAMAVFAMA